MIDCDGISRFRDGFAYTGRKLIQTASPLIAVIVFRGGFITLEYHFCMPFDGRGLVDWVECLGPCCSGSLSHSSSTFYTVCLLIKIKRDKFRIFGVMSMVSSNENLRRNSLGSRDHICRYMKHVLCTPVTDIYIA